MNTPVAPQWVLVRQAEGEPGDAPGRRRAARPAPPAGVVFPGGEPAVPGQQRRGRHGKTSAQRRRGMNRVSAANQARSAGSYRTRPACRRSTAFSCRSTSNSAPFARSLRATRTARPNNQRISRQAILSSTRPANHHRTSHADETGRSTTRSSFRAAQASAGPAAICLKPWALRRVSGSRGLPLCGAAADRSGAADRWAKLAGAVMRISVFGRYVRRERLAAGTAKASSTVAAPNLR
jgi:hypothetical protein